MCNKTFKGSSGQQWFELTWVSLIRINLTRIVFKLQFPAGELAQEKNQTVNIDTIDFNIVVSAEMLYLDSVLMGLIVITAT